MGTGKRFVAFWAVVMRCSSRVQFWQLFWFLVVPLQMVLQIIAPLKLLFALVAFKRLLFCPQVHYHLVHITTLGEMQKCELECVKSVVRYSDKFEICKRILSLTQGRSQTNGK